MITADGIHFSVFLPAKSKKQACIKQAIKVAVVGKQQLSGRVSGSTS